MPAAIDLTEAEFNEAYPVWLVWRAVDKNAMFSSGGILDQPQALMDNVLYIDGLYEKIVAQQQKRQKNG